MRSEQEMYALILDFAKDHTGIKAVYMNGSRANKNIPKDNLQDFDIVYVVEEIDSFRIDKSWISYFGEIAIMQEPDRSVLIESHRNPKEQYTFLMQFTDGNRIDLTFQSLDKAKVEFGKDKLTVNLLDKEHILPEIGAPSEEDYYVKKPSEELFAACCNQFWWVSTYIVKGLARKEVLYAKDACHLYVRPMLIKMLGWKAASKHDYQICFGKSYKFLERYLDLEDWNRLLLTFSGSDLEEMWKSLFILCDLFDETAMLVSEKMGYTYNLEESRKTREYIDLIRRTTRNDYK